MEIKRKLEIFTATNRRFVVHRHSSDPDLGCKSCGKAMVTAEEAAKIFGVSQRSIFQFVEAGPVHFTETEAGVLTICLTSLAELLDSEPALAPVRNGGAIKSPLLRYRYQQTKK